MSNSHASFAGKRFQFFFLISAFLFFHAELYAQCMIGNAVGRNDPENDFFWGQSFTAGCSGELEYVEFITGNGGGTQTETVLNIFNGETVSGTPAYSQNVQEMTFIGAGENLRIYLDDTFLVESGQKYAFELQVFVDLQISTDDPYPGGLAFENDLAYSRIDFVFNVSITDFMSAAQGVNSDCTMKLSKLTS